MSSLTQFKSMLDFPPLENVRKPLLDLKWVKIHGIFLPPIAWGVCYTEAYIE